MTYKPVPLAERCEYNHVLGIASFHRCFRRWVVQEWGEKWCRQHAPSTLKARAEKQDARHARLLEGVALQREIGRRAALYPELMAQVAYFKAKGGYYS